jgi:hypothetical protein
MCLYQLNNEPNSPPNIPEGRNMNKATKKRFEKISQIGCIVCRQHHGVITPALVHHLTGLENGRAMGRKSPDDHTIGLCLHHHTGFLGVHTMGKRAWEAEFGSQADYLEMTNQLLGETH